MTMTMTNSEFRRDSDCNKLFLREKLSLLTSIELSNCLIRTELTKEEITAKLGNTANDVLNGVANLTLIELSDLFCKIGYELEIKAVKQEVGYEKDQNQKA